MSPSFSVVLVTEKLGTAGWVAKGSLSVMGRSITRSDEARHAVGAVDQERVRAAAKSSRPSLFGFRMA